MSVAFTNMFDHAPSARMLAGLVAVLPAVLRWWWARPLVRSLDDPALPERLLASRRRNVYAVAGASGLLIVNWPQQTWWTLPILLLARLAAGYPIRRVLFDETWSLSSYLWFFVRLSLGVYAFWIVLAWMPEAIESAGSYDWVAAVVLASFLMVWNAWYGPLLRRVLGATPVSDPVLTSGFDRLVTASGLPRPRFEAVHLRGGVVANAVALPARSGAAVIVTDTLIARLTPDEVLAICAHELAHLEHYDRRRLRQLNVINLVLIATGAVLPPVLRLTAPSALSLFPVLWVIVVIAAMVARARDRQKQEIASDLRAVALIAQPEALVSALTKVHVIARLPRRWDAQFERQATHPSLARRIQAIRAAVATAPASLIDAATFSAADNRSSVTFQNERVEWRESDAATHSVSYSHLAELRILTSRARETRLLAIERTGRRWEIPIRRDDIQGVQAVLDIVDVRMPALSQPTRLSPVIVRLLAVFTMLLASGSGHIAVIVTALLATAQPVSAPIAALAMSAIAAAALDSRDVPLLTTGNTELWLAGPLLVFGVLLLGVSRALRHEQPNVRLGRSATGLAMCVVAVWGLVLWNASDAVGLHQNARDWPAAAVLGCALAGMLTRWRTRLALAGSVMLLIASTAMAFVGSTAFLDRFGVDAFLAPAAPVTFKTIDGSPLTQFPIAFIPTEVRLSRTGRYIAVASEDDDERTSFHVGRSGGPLATVDADSVVFIGDDRVLALKHDRAGATVSELAVDSPGTVVWQRQLTHVASAKLSVDVGHGEWRLLGLNHEHEIVRVAGDMDGRAVSERNWPVPDGTGEWADPIATAGERVMIASTRYERAAFTTGPWRRLVMAFPPVPRSRTRLRVLGPSGVDDVGVTHFNPTCDAALQDPDQVVCAAFDGTRTALFRLDSTLRRLTSIAFIPGRFYPQRYRSAGWSTGWGTGGAVALRLDSREAFRVALPEDDRSPQIDVSERVLGALSYGDGVATMRIYALD